MCIRDRVDGPQYFFDYSMFVLPIQAPHFVLEFKAQLISQGADAKDLLPALHTLNNLPQEFLSKKYIFLPLFRLFLTL